MQAQSTVHKGLVGVVADTTTISAINPDTNSLLYRGYPVQELAAKRSFEDVTYLLWHGELPNTEQSRSFQDLERANRALSPVVKAAIDGMSITAHPMDVCRTAVSLMGANNPLADDSSPSATQHKAIELLAGLPSIVAYDQRRRRHESLIDPRADLDYSQNFLYMTFGAEAAPEVVKAFSISMVLYAEHGFNASTFTARVIASTLSDLHSAVVGAIGALKGPLHGGANEAVMHAFEEIGIRPQTVKDPIRARTEAWLDTALAKNKKIMGFGHRVYKNGDSRVPVMKLALDRMVSHFGRPEIAELYAALESAMSLRKGIQPNVDYPSGLAYHLMGFDTAMFTPLFAAGRIPGWVAHFIEQVDENSLIRPLSLYSGVEERSL